MISIIVVNWNTRETTLQCLRAAGRTRPAGAEIIVVDNGSTDGSAGAFEALPGDRMEVVRLPENRGFAGGSNEGIRRARGEILCLLNSDTVPAPGAFHRMEHALRTRRAGLAGPYTNRAKGAQRKRPWKRILGRLALPTRQVEDLSFFCVMIDRRVIETVGLLDERFGLGTFEDDDYCRRARLAGFSCVIAGAAWVWHEAHATFRANGLDDAAEQAKNRRLFDEKWKETGP